MPLGVIPGACAPLPIVPTVELPPGIPLTEKVTLLSVALVTTTEKLTVPPGITEADEGVIETVGPGGGTVITPPPLPPALPATVPPAEPPDSTATNPNAKTR